MYKASHTRSGACLKQLADACVMNLFDRAARRVLESTDAVDDGIDSGQQFEPRLFRSFGDIALNLSPCVRQRRLALVSHRHDFMPQDNQMGCNGGADEA
jgi:hypothetical protein